MIYGIIRSNLLNEQKVLEILTNSLEKPPEGDTEQLTRDLKTYKNWKGKITAQHL